MREIRLEPVDFNRAYVEKIAPHIIHDMAFDNKDIPHRIKKIMEKINKDLKLQFSNESIDGFIKEESHKEFLRRIDTFKSIKEQYLESTEKQCLEDEKEELKQMKNYIQVCGEIKESFKWVKEFNPDELDEETIFKFVQEDYVFDRVSVESIVLKGYTLGSETRRFNTFSSATRFLQMVMDEESYDQYVIKNAQYLHLIKNGQ